MQRFIKLFLKHINQKGNSKLPNFGPYVSWLDGHADNMKVAGSSPAGPTKNNNIMEKEYDKLITCKFGDIVNMFKDIFYDGYHASYDNKSDNFFNWPNSNKYIEQLKNISK